MSESIFGRPSQHLLPSNPSVNPVPTTAQPDSQPPLNFKDFRFNSIGKQPELLSRISVPQLEHMDYRTPTPSPTYTPPPNLTNAQSQSSSRRSLLQQLAGGGPGTMDGSSGWHSSTSQSSGSLASRIQTNLAPPSDVPNVVHRPTGGYSFFGRAIGDASLIPPVEVLPQPPDSSPASPASFAPTIDPTTTHSPASSLLVNTTSAQTSRIPSPIAAVNVLPGQPTELSSSFPVTDDRERNLEPPSAVSTLDSLVARHDRLHTISNSLANMVLAPPLLPPHSPSPDPSSAMQINDNAIPPLSNRSQHTANSTAPRPLSANQLPGSNVSDMPTDTDHDSPALVQSLIQEYQTQRRVLFEAAQNLNSTLDVLQRVHADSENALTHQIRTFTQERQAFEHMKRVDAAALQQQSQELQQKHEELNARESDLALLEKESKAREDARKGMIARRHAQEEEKRVAEAKRVQETKEQVDTALKEVMEVRALTESARHQFGQLASEAVPDDVPTEPKEGMDMEEIAAVESRNDLLRDIKHLRQLHTDKLHQLEEFNHTLRRLEDERKKRQAEEAEHRRAAEERRRRMLAEAAQSRQALDEKRRQFEAERKQRAIAKGREHTPSLAVEKTHTEARPHGLKSAEMSSRPGEVIQSQRPATADTTRVRATREANSFSPTTHSMSVDDRASTSHRTILLPEIHISPVRPKSTTSVSKQKNGTVSGGVRLSAPTPKLRGEHLPRKPLSGPASLPSSDHATENALNLPRPSSTTPMLEGGHGSSFPDQLAAEFNRISKGDTTPDHRPFPRTPKSQTILDAANAGSEELNIGPAPGVSPTHQNINLRHLKRSRGRVEENDSGDRSVRTLNLKNEEILSPSVKKEEADDHSRQLAPTLGLPASLPPRPAVIPTPRPWMHRKRQAVSQSQTNSISSSPLENNKDLTREGVTTADEQYRDPPSGSNQFSQTMNAPAQPSLPPEISKSLLLGPGNSASQSSETHIDTGGRLTQDAENRGSSSESATVTLSHGLNGEDLPRNNRKFTDERRKARKGNGSRRVLVDHYSPRSAVPRSAVASPPQPHHTTESWYSQAPTNGPRAEPMRAGSPIAGRKRPSEFSDNEHVHRARRPRSDVWIAQEHDRSRADPHRLDWERHPEPDERRTAYRTPPSPDRIRAYSPDIQRMGYENRTYSPPPEKPIALPPRLEQSYSRRPEHDDAYQQYQSRAPSYSPVAGQYHDTRVSHTYEPMVEERMDAPPEPPLLARMSTSQHVPPAANSHPRGRGEPSRGRSDQTRGRGRGNFASRSGLTLLERLKSGPSSLKSGPSSFGDRLT